MLGHGEPFVNVFEVELLLILCESGELHLAPPEIAIIKKIAYWILDILGLIAHMTSSALPQRLSRRTTDQVYRILQQRIIDGTMAPGSRVDIEALVTEFDVSRTPIREAVLQLASVGLVERQPYRGTVVTGVDHNRLEEVTALRILLEGMATELAALRLTDDDVVTMAQALDAIDALDIAAGKTNEEFNEFNAIFHNTLYAAADSPVLVRQIQQLGFEADRMRIHYPVQPRFSQDDHRTILQACVHRDAKAAGDAMRAHILNAHKAKTYRSLGESGVSALIMHTQKQALQNSD